MAKRKKISNKQRTIQKEYQRERNRIKSYIRRYEKQGFIFKDNLLPKKPKKVTEASIRRLKKLKPKELQKNAVYSSELTYGEILTFQQGKKLLKEEKKRAELESKKTNTTILSNFRRDLLAFPSEASEILLRWYDSMISDVGEGNASKAVWNIYTNDDMIELREAYKRDSLISAIERMSKYFKVNEEDIEELHRIFEEDVSLDYELFL